MAARNSLRLRSYTLPSVDKPDRTLPVTLPWEIGPCLSAPCVYPGVKTAKIRPSAADSLPARNPSRAVAIPGEKCGARRLERIVFYWDQTPPPPRGGVLAERFVKEATLRASAVSVSPPGGRLGRGPSVWRVRTGLSHSWAQPSDSLSPDPIWPCNLPDSCYTSCAGGA